MDVRAAEKTEIDRLARIWFDGWQDAHAEILPAQLRRARTLASFTDRLHAALDQVRVAGPAGEPSGFHILKDDELYQLYVSAEARGRGVAAALIAHAESTLAERGVTTAWLSCAIGNDRAARFYEKSGWRRAGTMVSRLEIPGDVIELETWRYEKVLRPR
jgi:GNAT superfamily N-acetyltransferase